MCGKSKNVAFGAQVAFVGLASQLPNSVPNIDVQSVYFITLSHIRQAICTRSKARSYLLNKNLCRTISNAAVAPAQTL